MISVAMAAQSSSAKDFKLWWDLDTLTIYYLLAALYTSLMSWDGSHFFFGAFRMVEDAFNAPYGAFNTFLANSSLRKDISSLRRGQNVVQNSITRFLTPPFKYNFELVD